MICFVSNPSCVRFVARARHEDQNLDLAREPVALVSARDKLMKDLKEIIENKKFSKDD